MAHLGAIAILLSFGVLQGGSWQFTFDAMRAAHLAPPWATAAFCLALNWFWRQSRLGAAACVVARSAPRRAFSRLRVMSGICSKTALYGNDSRQFRFYWATRSGGGTNTALSRLFSRGNIGVVFAAAQTDMKTSWRIPPSKNVGILFTGLGLAIIFAGADMRAAAALHP